MAITQNYHNLARQPHIYKYITQDMHTTQLSN